MEFLEQSHEKLEKSKENLGKNLIERSDGNWDFAFFHGFDFILFFQDFIFFHVSRTILPYRVHRTEMTRFTSPTYKIRSRDVYP
jgi:hypothetical protein